jgi:recombination protein RecA
MAAKKKGVAVDTVIPKDQAEKRKMADLIVSQIRSSYGSGAIMKMNEVINQDVTVVSSGSLSVDLAAGVGGFPKGRIIEIYGPESSGKTSLALATIAQAQKTGGLAAFVDAEHALDPEWAKKFGVSLNDLYVSQPGNGEEALEIVDNLVRSNAFDVIVVDSVAALVPKSEIEGNMGDAQMGVQARLMSQALRKLTGAISKSNTIVIFINQIRMKIGVMFGNPETTTGGQALKFFASMRLEVRKVGALKQGEENIGVRMRVKFVKNKLAAPFKQVEFDMMFGEPGVFSLAGEIIDVGPAYGIVVKTGNTYTLNIPGQEEEKMGVGRENAKNYLYARNELMYDAKAAIVKAFKAKIASDILATETRNAENLAGSEGEGEEEGEVEEVGTVEE